MYRIFKAKKDTYITNRIISGKRKFYSNVGNATTLDLFKIYGLTYTNDVPNIELSRLLIDFDLSDLINEFNKGTIDTSDPTFNCTLKLFSVESGHTLPSNFNVICYPLAKEFSEGDGSDIVYYKDLDSCNFISASYDQVWGGIGANLSGTYGDLNIDIIKNDINAGDLFFSQSFITGKENLEINVTSFISATLNGLIPNYGFRISYDQNEENDSKSRFVKRFASRNARNKELHPQLIVKYDDSISDNTKNFVFDYEGTLFLYNNVRGTLKNIISGTTEISGSNSVLLKLSCNLLSGTYTQYVTGSQFILGNSYKDGIYNATFSIPKLSQFLPLIIEDKLTFNKEWLSLDKSVSYYSGTIDINSAVIGTQVVDPSRYYVNITNTKHSYDKNEVPRFRLHIENVDNPYIRYEKTPFVSPSTFPEKVYYRVKNSITKEILIPFDVELNSTRISNDSNNLYFDFHMLNLQESLTYDFDILIIENGIERAYESVCSPFTINNTQFSKNTTEASRSSMSISRNQQVYLYLNDFVDEFTTNAEQSIFTLTYTPFPGTLPLVYVGGIYQSSIYYTIIGTTVTFGEPVDANTQVEIIYKYRS